MTTNQTFPIRVRIRSVRITAAGLSVDGLAAVDENNEVHFVVAGDDPAAHDYLLDLIDGPDCYEVIQVGLTHTHGSGRVGA